MRIWRSRLTLPIAATLLVVLVAACGGNSPRPDIEAFGFLPIPTQTPVPTITPLSPEARGELCPALPEDINFSVGQRVNLYDSLILENAAAISVVHGLRRDWVLGDNVERVLSMLDRDTTLEPWGISQRDLFVIDVNMARPGHPQCGLGAGPFLFMIDQEAGKIGLHSSGMTQAPMPAGFAEEVLASLSASFPTDVPGPTLIPYTPSPTRTPLLVPDEAPFFNHPEDELLWAGPDDRVYSRTRQHCAAPDVLKEGFGIPDLILVEDGNGYWAIAAVPPPQGLRSTGYHHEGWEIWQGEDPKTIYLLNDDLDYIAFEYENFGCI